MSMIFAVTQMCKNVKKTSSSDLTNCKMFFGHMTELFRQKAIKNISLENVSRIFVGKIVVILMKSIYFQILIISLNHIKCSVCALLTVTILPWCTSHPCYL